MVEGGHRAQPEDGHLHSSGAQNVTRQASHGRLSSGGQSPTELPSPGRPLPRPGSTAGMPQELRVASVLSHRSYIAVGGCREPMQRQIVPNKYPRNILGLADEEAHATTAGQGQQPILAGVSRGTQRLSGDAAAPAVEATANPGLYNEAVQHSKQTPAENAREPALAAVGQPPSHSKKLLQRQRSVCLESAAVLQRLGRAKDKDESLSPTPLLVHKQALGPSYRQQVQSFGGDWKGAPPERPRSHSMQSTADTCRGEPNNITAAPPQQLPAALHAAAEHERQRLRRLPFRRTSLGQLSRTPAAAGAKAMLRQRSISADSAAAAVVALQQSNREHALVPSSRRRGSHHSATPAFTDLERYATSAVLHDLIGIPYKGLNERYKCSNLQEMLVMCEQEAGIHGDAAGSPCQPPEGVGDSACFICIHDQAERRGRRKSCSAQCCAGGACQDGSKPSGACTLARAALRGLGRAV